MKFYESGDSSKPVIFLFPGTCCLYSSFDHIPFAWSMNWVQDILSRQIFNYGTEKIWIAALTTGGLLLTLLWFSHWEGRKNYE